MVLTFEVGVFGDLVNWILRLETTFGSFRMIACLVHCKEYSILLNWKGFSIYIEEPRTGASFGFMADES